MICLENIANIIFELCCNASGIERFGKFETGERPKIVEIVKLHQPLSGERSHEYIRYISERLCAQICPSDDGWYLKRLLLRLVIPIQD